METESDSREAQSSTSVSHKSLPHRLLEGLFIIVTVLLGFGVAQFGEYRNKRELVRLTNGALCRRPRFDPTARVASVRLLSLTIENIRTAEAFLIALYRKHLPIIRAASEAS